MRSPIPLIIWALTVSALALAQGPPPKPAQALPPKSAQAPAATAPRSLSGNQAARQVVTPVGVLRRIAAIDIPGLPRFQSIAMIGDKVALAHSGASTVDIFDIAKRRVISQIKGLRSPAGLAVDESAGKLYIGDTLADEIVVVSTQNWSVENRIALKASPQSLLVVSSLGRLYSANWNDRSLSLVDLKSGALRTVPMQASPVRLAYSPDSKELYATLEDLREVAVLSPDLQLVRRLPVKGSQPTGIAYDAAHHRLYVAVRHAVVILDAESGQELGRLDAPAGIDGLDLHGEHLFAAASGGVVLVYRTTGAGLVAEQEVPTEVKGQRLAYDSQRQIILLPGGDEGHSKLLLLKFVPGPVSPPTVASTQDSKQ